MDMNSLPRWLISITHMPVPRQSSISSPARGRTSSGSTAGPGAEIENACHQWIVGPSWTAGGSPAAASPPRRRCRSRHCRCRRCPLPRRARRSARRPRSFSPSPSAISVTPCVERPISRICATAVRISTPPVEISITSSWSSTSTAPTSAPLPLRGLDRDHALAAAAVLGVLGDRRALAEAVLGGGEHGQRSRPSPPACTPRAGCRPRAGACRARRSPVRPIGRTSSSWKRIALPSDENSITS